MPGNNNRFWNTVALMVVFAAIAVLAGGAGLRHWAAVSGATKAYYSALFAGGLALLVCSGLALLSRQVGRRIARAGLAAAVTLGVAQAAGITSNSILCYTPG